MIKRNCYDYIIVGLYIRYLRHRSVGKTDDVKSDILELERLLRDLNFNVSLNGFNLLRDFGVGLKDGLILTVDEIERLNELLNPVEEIIRAEAISNPVYIMEQKRYSLDYLINQPDKIFSSGVYDKLPRIGKYDFEEGFKCIAVARPTAAAFHILRGTEDVIKNLLYFKKIKKNREKRPMWDNMIKGIKAKKKTGVEPSLLETLDYIRKTYRNPTDHPEEIYDLDKAQDLLGLCLEAVNKIAKLN